MFDTTVEEHYHETVVTPVTRVIEKSITPDKVTEMYDKVKKECEDTIIRSFIIKDTLMECAVVIYFEPQHAQYKINVRFLINGDETLISEYLPDFVILKQEERLYDFVRKLFIDALVAKVMPYVCKNIADTVFPKLS